MRPLLWSALLCVGLAGSALAQPALFSDDFDQDTSGQWNVFQGSGNGVSDYTAQFNFDYSTMGIPSAPNSTGGTRRGLKMTVNKDDVAATAGVSAYPKDKTFSGDYALRFDMWLGYNGPAFGGTGSTEFGIFGINHTGNKVVWDDATVTDSDGVWFAVVGEGGAGTAGDYRAYEGYPGRPLLLSTLEGGFLDRDENGTLENEVNPTQAATFPLKAILPAPPGETPGAPGKQWVQVEVRQRSGELTWLINGFVIASRANFGSFQSGNIMLGNMDIFTSIASPKEQNFVIFDNVRVVNLTGVPALPVVDITSTDAEAVESGGDTLSFTVKRVGDTSQPLTVNLRIAGTATPGADYPALPASVIIPAGQDSVTTTITPTNDAAGEPDEDIVVALVSGAGYEVRERVVVDLVLKDDGDKPLASVRAVRAVAYELNPGRVGRFAVELNTPGLTDLTVPLTVGGTAVNGTHYQTIPTLASFPAGITRVDITVVPRNDSEVNADRTVDLTLNAGDGYALATNATATVRIRNDDLTPGTVVFSENFDADHTASWTVNQGPSDGLADFYFDYATVGVPAAPNTGGGTRRGLKLQANLSSGVFGGLSVSPTGRAFAGNYRLRFDLWQNFNGPFPDGGSGSTQITGAGIGTAGGTPQWPGGTQDSLWFAATADGGSSVDYRAYSPAAPTGYTEASGIFAAGSRGEAAPYYAELGEESAPLEQQGLFVNQTGATYPGTMGMQWHDVVIAKQGNTVTWTVDGLLLATVDVSSVTLGGSNILFMFSDINAGSSTDPDAPYVAFGLIDNVRVEQLPSEVTPATIEGIVVENSTVRITFTAQDAQPGDFTVVSSASVADGYAAETGATITSIGANRFQATLPVSGSERFYRIRR